MSETYDRGLKIRREVLGGAYVDNALRNTDEFSKPFEDLVTEYCRGRDLATRRAHPQAAQPE